MSSGALHSMLYVPGADAGKLAKVGGLGADAYILDLEDAVAPSAKPAARALVAATIRERGGAGALWVRVNPAATGMQAEDLRAVVASGLDGIVLPKVGRAADVVLADAALARLEHERGLARGAVALIATIESAAGVGAVDEIARAATRLRCLSFGAGDLSLELGLDWPPPEGLGPTVLAAKVALVLASARARLEPPHDGVFPDFRDDAGLRAEAEQSRRLGLVGKHAIHPDQLATIHETFAPSAAALAAAAAVVEAYERGIAQGVGGVHIDGRFIDHPVAEHARRTLAADRRSRGP